MILICNVTGKSVKWTNQKIIDAKIKHYGSEEAFRKAFKCRGANKKKLLSVRSNLLKDGEVNDVMMNILNEGVKLAPNGFVAKHLTAEQYALHYQQKVDALVAVRASASEINWMKQRLDRWRNSTPVAA
jgi:hypothetical protein